MSGIIGDNVGRQSGVIKAAGGGGALSLVAAASFTGSATVEITTFGSGFNDHKIVFNWTYSAGSGYGGVYMYFSTGGAYITSSVYSNAGHDLYAQGGSGERSAESTDKWQIVPDGMYAGNYHNTVVDVANLTNALTKGGTWMDGGANGDSAVRVHLLVGAGGLNNAGVSDAIKFVESSGRELVGTYQIYGYSRS